MTINEDRRRRWARVALVLLDALFVIGVVCAVVIVGLAFISIGAWRELR